GNYDVGIVQLKSDKINPVSNTESYFFNGARWGIWFSNGSRDLVETGEVVLDENSVELFPNPCHDNVNILSKSEYFDKIEIFNTQGLKIWEKRSNFNPQEKIVVPLRDFNSGCYVIKLSRSGNVIIMKIIKE
nr:T9SS type A sorting domain-containing protein [Saprospiraceae bacterium]